jgi:hypothetical protein
MVMIDRHVYEVKSSKVHSLIFNIVKVANIISRKVSLSSKREFCLHVCERFLALAVPALVRIFSPVLILIKKLLLQ